MACGLRLADSDLYALFGHPVSHSRSPDIHHAFARQTGENIRYELIDVAPADFAARVHRFFSEGGAGANATVPHKLAAFEFAEHVSSDAFRAGAVNTLALLEDGSVFGDNTDGAGLVRDLVVNRGVTIEGRRILLLGAGGAARGAVGPLLDEGPSELVVANRHPGRAALLAQLFAETGPVRGSGLDVEGGFDLVVNATSASLAGEVPAIHSEAVNNAVVYDMFYSEQPTAFMQWAASNGAREIFDGWGMMVEQAAESFFIWRGMRPDTAPLLDRSSLVTDH